MTGKNTSELYEDWSQSFDDMDAADWENYMGGPDDDEIDRYYENYENLDQAYEEEYMELKTFEKFADASAFAKSLAQQGIGHNLKHSDDDNPWVVTYEKSQVGTQPSIKKPNTKKQGENSPYQTSKPAGGKTNTQKGITEKERAAITKIEQRPDLTDEQKISRIKHIACATCAGIAVQPIPFADIFILIPVQACFGARIAAIRKVPVTESEITDLIKEIAGVIGLGITAQQMAIATWKIVSFGAGGLLTIPLVYALTYAIMTVIDKYYLAKAKKRSLTDDEIKAIWKTAFPEGEERAKKDKDKEGDK